MWQYQIINWSTGHCSEVVTNKNRDNPNISMNVKGLVLFPSSGSGFSTKVKVQDDVVRHSKERTWLF